MRLAYATAFLAAALLAGCDVSRKCDPGEVFRDGYCFRSAGDAAAAAVDGPATDAARTDGGEDGGACGSDAAVPGLGAACARSEDCTCTASYCAVMPGATTGFCTLTGCKDMPALCPAGYSCFDLSVFDPTLPSFCNRG